MDKLNTFLEESNKIENVYDRESLRNAHKAWKFIIKKKKLTIKNILKTHKILMKNHLSGKTLGKFRTCGVYVGGHTAPLHAFVPLMMWEWAKKTQAFVQKMEGEIRASHVRFEKIHGFVDGNGRLGRILMNWERAKHGYDILIIESKNRQEYYKWFGNKK